MAFAILSSIACTDPISDPAPGFTFELETERMVIRGRGRYEEELCGGTADWIDRYVDSLAPYYGLPDGQIGRYVWYSPEEFDESGVCGPWGACTGLQDGVPTVFAPNVPIEHEIVHVLQRHVSPESCVAMLEEGLAEYLRGPYPEATPGEMDKLVALSFEGGDLTSADYARARHFVSFLVETYDLETVIDLCAATPKGSTLEDFDVASLDLLGRDLEELLGEYSAYPECPDSRDRAKLLECSRPPSVEVGLNMEESINVMASCSASDAVGPHKGTYHLSHQIRILEEGDYSVTLSSSAELPQYTIRTERCASCIEDPNYVALGEFPTWVEPGDYAFDLSIPVDYEGEITIHVKGW